MGYKILAFEQSFFTRPWNSPAKVAWNLIRFCSTKQMIICHGKQNTTSRQTWRFWLYFEIFLTSWYTMLSLKPCPLGSLLLLPTSCFTGWMNLYTFTNFMFMFFLFILLIFRPFQLDLHDWNNNSTPLDSHHCEQLTAPASCFCLGLQGMRIRTTTSVARLETPLKFQHWDEPKIRCQIWSRRDTLPEKLTTCLIGDTSWNGWFSIVMLYSFPVGTVSKAHHSWYLC